MYPVPTVSSMTTMNLTVPIQCDFGSIELVKQS